MNSYFNFSKKQIKFVTALAVSAVVFSLILLVSAYTSEKDNNLNLEIHLGEPTRLPSGTFLIDPNTSPADSLELLPGIGKTLADRIVEYRLNHRFETEIDITEVYGIGPKLYEKIKPYLKIKHL